MPEARGGSREDNPTSNVTGSGPEELPHVQGQRRQPRGATPPLRSGAAAKKSYPMSKEKWLCRHRRAEREQLHVQGQEGRPPPR